MRKLASVRRIDYIRPIEGADKIEKAILGGWPVVVQKDLYREGDLAVYCEIDSFLPHSLAPFLTKPGHEPKEYEGVLGERLKTIRLRGQLSQGLLLPLYILRGWEDAVEGTDVTEELGILKWEPFENAGKTSSAKGNFPIFIPRTDQERVQNLSPSALLDVDWDTFEAPLKLDGSSCTVYHMDGRDGVCSRNIDLKDEEGNAFWDIAKKLGLHEKLRSTGRNLALQGELIAPNIQKNHEQVTKPEWYCFDIFDIDAGVYMLPVDRRELCRVLEIPHAPVWDASFRLRCGEQSFNDWVQGILAIAEGPGKNPGVQREGLVFKSNHRNFSFKAVSNSYLLKKG